MELSVFPFVRMVFCLLVPEKRLKKVSVYNESSEPNGSSELLNFFINNTLLIIRLLLYNHSD